MSPPLLVTEDTPPDMLTGHMDLRLVLPNGNRVRMSVDRRTPMMDLLVQVTTAYKISPAGHVLQPYGEHGHLPYKPSTPIGALDTWTVHIVPKHQALQNPASKISLKQVQQPFEQTFRFQVNLPKNQLFVLRVTGRTTMGDVLRQACSEKGLDPHKYALRHPKHSDRNLCEELSVMEYGHNQVSMVSNKTLPSSVSSEDILAMQAYSGKSSESSSRSLSPDSSVSPQAPVQPSRPLRKRRPAPKPPVQPPQAAKPKQKQPQKDPPSNGPVICHSRTSSDSSGYHEASVLSESPDSNNSSLPDSLPRRSKLPSKSEPKPTNKLSRSLSNLHHESTAPTTSMKPAQSTSCLAPSRKKKPAPPPPVLSITEEEKEEMMPPRTSQTLPPGARLVHEVQVETRADPSSRLSPSPIVASVEPKGLKMAEEPKIISNPSLSDLETERVEDEIERMFEEATREHVSLESGVDVGESSPSIPSPEASGLPSPDLISDVINDNRHLLPETPRKEVEEDPFNWEYKLPAPPTFRDVDRDDASSPSLTEYSTMTVGKMKEVLYQPSISGDRPEPPKIIGVTERRAVVQELTSVVEDPSKVLVTPREVVTEVAPVERMLNNFKITTYSSAKNPAKVYEDTNGPRYEDVIPLAMYKNDAPLRNNETQQHHKHPGRSPKYDDKATSPIYDEHVASIQNVTRHDDTSSTNDVKRAPRRDNLASPYETKLTSDDTVASSVETNLPRRTSFKDGRPYMSGGVKRSLSQVSPLSRTRVGLSASNGNLSTVVDDDDDYDGYEPVVVRTKSNLRKTTSELSINVDLSNERDEYNDKNERHNGLQSINVLRSILPQLSRSQNALNAIDSSTYEPVIVRKEEKTYSRPNVNISLSTWGERPKRQISIKSDRDYVVGGVKPPMSNGAAPPKPAPVTAPKPPPKPAEKPVATVVKSSSFKGPKTMAYKMLETGNTKPLKQILERDKMAEKMDHVPIVRSVELKKPFKMELENRMVKEPVAPPCLPETKRDAVETKRGSVEMKRDAVETKRVSVETKRDAVETKRVSVETKRDADRPASCYLFGYEPLTNVPAPPKKFTSIVDLSRPALRPASSRLLKPRQRDVDPREELMASIRGFGGKNSLRKVSAR